MTTAPWLVTPRAYTGIGSRSCPSDIIALMRRIAAALARLGWALRSGGAPGADTAFEEGARGASGRIGLYLPWRGFEGRTRDVVLHQATERARLIVPSFHPTWRSLGRGARALHARNAHQVLGSTCGNPASFVVCWTPDGATTARETSARTGGTGTAVRLASAYGVAVWNLRRDDHRPMWERVASYRPATPV